MEKYPNGNNQFRMVNNMSLNGQGSSSLSANAPEFVPGGGGAPIPMIPGYANGGGGGGGAGGPPGGEWVGPPQQPGMPPNQFNQPTQFPNFTPYAPQQPIAEIQAFALQQRLAHLSINDRLRQFQQQQGVPVAAIGNPVDSESLTYDVSLLLAANNHQLSNGMGGSGGFGGGPPQHIPNGRPRGGGGGGGGNFHHHNNHHSHHNNRRQQQQQQHHHHHHQPHPRQMAEAAAAAAAAAAAQDPLDESAHQPSETEDMALNYLNEVINELENKPGMFETYQKKLKEVFYELASNNFVMSNALELLFKQSVKSQNFRYMGARICNLLDDLDITEASLFRNLLRMKMDFERQELIQFMASEQYTVRGTTLFLAELYMQLRRPNESFRNIEIADSIVFSIQLLLTRATPENLKCVCQTLKLCGFELDLDCNPKMESIVQSLESHKNNLDTSTGRLIQSVLDLRARHWGRTESITSPDNGAPQDYSDGPVFYGPDGQVLTEEENMFLADNLPSQLIEDINGDDSGEELVDDDDNAYDLEIQLAFKEFVNSNKQHQANAVNGSSTANNDSTSTGNQ